MKKVVLIGAGNIGGQALSCLGPELVAYYVDNHKAGQSYFNKPVYAMDKLVEDRGKYLVLLTMANFECRDELIDQLNEMGIKDFYYFDSTIYLKNIFQRSDSQVYIRRTLYEDMMGIDPKRVCVLGHKRRIGRFVAELFEIEAFYDEEEGNSISDLSNQYDYIFVNVKNYSHEIHNQLKAANVKIYYIAHYHKCYDFLARRGLLEFAGKYKGKKRCFIIENGPSLTSEDLDLLAEHNEFCIGLNMIHKAYNKTKWRPNYICINNILTISRTLDPVFENNSCPVFLTDAVRLYFSPFQYDKAILYHETDNRDQGYRFMRFGTELSDGTIPGGWTVAYVAIELAAYMGFKEIYLLGMDKPNWAKPCGDDCELKSPIMPDKREELITWVCRSAYRRAKAASIEYGGFKIYDATRGGCLEEFERVNFDKLFDGLS